MYIFKSNPNLALKVFSYSSRTFKSRVRIVCFATSGVIPPDVIPLDYEPYTPPKRVTDLAQTFGTFDKKLEVLPARTEPDYDTKVESNNKIIWNWASEKYRTKVFGSIPGFKVPAGDLFNHNTYLRGYTGALQFTQAMSNCKTVFARGVYADIWDAVGICVQNYRELTQQLPVGLNMTDAEFAVVRDNLSYIGKGFSYSAKTTQSAAYIKGTPVGTKKQDAEEFQAWYRSKAHPLTKIIRWNTSDIPLGYDFAVITAFQQDPNVTNAKKIEATLLRLQQEGLDAYRASLKTGTVINIDDWLASK